MITLPLQKSYIHGCESRSSSANGSRPTFENLNPATGEIICEVEVASESDVESAVQSSLEGFKKWSAFSGAQRGRVLHKAAQIIRERLDELAHLETLDTGKPIQESKAVDIPSSAEAIEYYAGVASTLHGQHFDLGKSFVYTRREPLGVCAGIGAWNYPLQIACWKSAPALACGNSMIYKPSELTPLTAIKLAEIYKEAGVPDGVFNVLQGPGKIGQLLSQHPKIAKISVTGSVPTGQKVMEAAASTLKHITLELGGKSPLIIFEDAPLDRAVSGALMANFFTQGEICSNGTRVFVHETLFDEFLAQVQARTEKIKVGDPFDPSTQMGALISQPHLEKVLGYIESGKKEGAVLKCGGKRPKWSDPKWNAKEGKLQSGNFIEPTIFAHCHDEMKIVREEIFGPVMSILTFKTEEEVIERANRTSYGLGAGVFTKDIQRAHGVVAQLQAGTCWINNYNITPVEIPFGGYKLSGLGRENGLAAIQHYTQVKSVYVEMGEIQSSF